ncbi:MAG: KorB domain-containing protein [Thermoguttaceae bacterium]|jgi:hypothetical protein|nr:KorB domain-containing protein [Thermoguttaceae bacterium]
MSESVELSTLNLRYEGHRLRDDAREARLLASIAERGIAEPLEGVDAAAGSRLLLNGFKRYRCAKKLGLGCVPYVSLGQDEAAGILNLMRVSTDKALGILEQARFVVELLSVHGMSVAEVAEALSRSKGWVSMRQGLLEEMRPSIQAVLFRGAVPVYSYMYTLRPFMRMNGVSTDEIERFIHIVAGKRLSVRDIELLAHGYFRGPAPLREAIDGGRLGWLLDRMKRAPEEGGGCGPFERALLGDLQRVRKLMQRVMAHCDDRRLSSRAFYAQANLLTGGLLSTFEPFCERMKEFYDRSGHASCHVPVASGRDATAPDQPAIPSQPQRGAGGHPPGGNDAPDGAEGQDPRRPGPAPAALPGM